MQGLKVVVVVFFLGFATAVPTKEHDVYLQAVEKDLDDVELPKSVISCAKDAVPKIVACFKMGHVSDESEWEHSEESSSEESLSEILGGNWLCVVQALLDFATCTLKPEVIEQDHITALGENRKEIEKVIMALKKNALNSKA